MSLFRKQANFTYCSQQGTQQYLFDIVIDTQGQLFVRNVWGANGVVLDVPSPVLQDIETAKGITLEAIGQTQVEQGIVLFTGQYTRPVVIPAGILNNTNYRVVYSVVGGTPPIQTTDQTITGFTVVSNVALGTTSVPVGIGYTVLVSTHESSAVGGTLTFTAADLGVRSIVFPTPMSTAAYQIVLSPNGFFPAQVISQSKSGFSVQIGYTVALTETVTVGYDLFVG